MFRVAIVGHSLVPVSFDSSPFVSVSISRKPGAKFQDWECSEFSEFFAARFDLAIVFLGGNDLAIAETQEVVNRAKFLAERASECANQVRVCTIEQRNYSEFNRFRVSNQAFSHT